MTTSKRVCAVFLLFSFTLIFLSWAEAREKKAPPPVNDAVKEFQKQRAFVDYLSERFSARNVRYQDIRISPYVRTEEWLEIPFEIGLMFDETELVPVLEVMNGFPAMDSQMAINSVTISVSAESNPKGLPLLTVTLNGKTYLGPKFPHEDVRNANNAWVVGMKDLLRTTTFTPQIRKKIQRVQALDKNLSVDEAKVPAAILEETRGHWITNLRIDSDHRVQMTGYTIHDMKLVTVLGEALAKTGSFYEIFLSMANKNIYEKVPVWRFDMVSKMR